MNGEGGAESEILHSASIGHIRREHGRLIEVADLEDRDL